MTASSAEATPTRLRLHITPFNETLLKTFIPPSILPSATNIAYHTVQTFPDKGFGYIELPTMEAHKIKQKLNGAVLKGQKIRIEEAKPEKRKVREKERKAEAKEDEGEERPKKRAKKEGHKEGVLPGIEMPEERKVMRGWTESIAEKREKKQKRKEGKDKKDKKDKKDAKKTRESSKYISEPEVLFRTKLPPNVAAANESTKKSKKKAKGSSKAGEDVVVHEFERTQKYATFLRSDDTRPNHKPVKEFVEGQGWVDETGEVVEPETDAQRAKRSKKSSKRKTLDTPSVAGEEKANGSARVQSKEENASKLPNNDLVTPKKSSVRFEKTARTPESSPEPSSSDVSSSDVSTDSEDSNDSPDEEDEDDTAQQSSELPDSIPLDATPSPETSAATPAVEVHPLEALYKRPKPSADAPAQPLQIKTGFSFFGGVDEEGTEDGNDSNEDGDAGMLNPPLTPFTRRDREVRGERSAAPTPDTAMKERFSFSAEEDDEDDQEADDTVLNEVMYEAPATTAEDAGFGPVNGEGAAESEFAKWFWENRGENNRAWKRRRREAMKLKRRRENRRLSRRVI